MSSSIPALGMLFFCNVNIFSFPSCKQGITGSRMGTQLSGLCPPGSCLLGWKYEGSGLK